MPRLTAPPRPGTPHALSGRGTTINLDQGTADRLAWLENVCKRTLRHEAGKSVLVRRAVAFYALYMERVLVRTEAEELADEAAALKYAARGEQDALSEEELIAVPPKLYSTIRQEAAEVARAAGVARVKASMAADLENWDHEARRRGHE